MTEAGELVISGVLAFTVVGLFFWLLWYVITKKGV